MDSGQPGRRRSRLQARAEWFSYAKPIDYVLAVNGFYAGLPVVGRYCAPFGVIAAAGTWAYRLAGPIGSGRGTRGQSSPPAADTEAPLGVNELAEASLRDVVAADRLAVDWPAPDRLPPVARGNPLRRRFLHRGAVRYGESPAQVMDVWRRRDLPPGPAPVLVFVPGGGWIFGTRRLQGYALLAHLAAQGWVCLSIDYRVSPQHRWPRHVQDVKAAVAWARANADQFGGDRDFVAVAGCSAGGHLASLVGLTPGAPEFEGELAPDADTSVDAVVSIYGRYDWEDRSTEERDTFVDFLEHVVVKRRFSRHRAVYRAASPIARVHADAPPFFVLHGGADSVIPVQQARDFVDTLRTRSRSVAAYLELPGAQHAFDMIDGARTGAATTAIGLFLNEIRRNHTARPRQAAV